MPQITVSPQDGGHLITRASSADAGTPHYTTKRNFRRDLSDEMTREGCDYFIPFPSADDIEFQPFPSGFEEPITLLHTLRRPNGEAAVIAGTSDSLYRLYKDTDGYYVDGYYVTVGDPYYVELQRWHRIATGFSANGSRWEAENINGEAVFNNGIDLPVRYRVEWQEAQPLYELREQGIVCVGTISSLDGALLLGDITELRAGDYEEILEIVDSGDVTVSQVGATLSGSITATSNGTTITASAGIFSASDVGRLLVWFNGAMERIVSYISPTQVTVTAGQVVASATSFKITDLFTDAGNRNALRIVASGSFFTAGMEGDLVAWPNGTSRRIVEVVSATIAIVDSDGAISSSQVLMDNPNTYLGKEGLEDTSPGAPAITGFDRRQYRLIWSELFQPSRFKNQIPVTFTVGSPTATTKRMCKSLELGLPLSLTGAGVAGGVLNLDQNLDPVVSTQVSPGHIKFSTPALSGGNGTVIRAESVGSISGYEDLQDDGSGILKMSPLLSRTIIYADTNIFIGRYTGVAERPFEFERVVVPHGRALHFRNTLACVNGVRHVYAGRGRFYSFDLTNRVPQPIPLADMCADLFFAGSSIEDTELIYAADNFATQEIWFVNPNSAEKVLAYDYLYNTFSTTDYNPSCAATLKKLDVPLIGETSELFVMGFSNGTLAFYGRSTEEIADWVGVPSWADGKKIFYRRKAFPYNIETFESVSYRLSSGRMHFGSPYGEKEFHRYQLEFSSETDIEDPESPEMLIEFFNALSERSDEVSIGSASVSTVESEGMIPLHAIAHFFRDDISISSASGVSVRIHARTFDIIPIGSKGHNRKNTHVA